ncbi:MAG: NAD(P)-dependent oxidoreductase [Gammaproteobacteria bacterium]|nr:NAD(P)-dependent oxidoreductase [Gammaproteobacteria bacterium]
MKTKEKIGFIGLGLMGAGIASNLLKHFDELSVFDTSPDAMKNLAAEGCRSAASARELATTSSIIQLCLPNAEAVEQVLFGPEGVVRAGRSNVLILDSTTLLKKEAIEFSDKLSEYKIPYCDCPVSGLPKKAADGTLTVMFGGAPEHYSRTEGVLGAAAGTVVYCGPVGNAQLMKAVNNIIYNINIAALCEVLPFAVAAGLDAKTLEQVVLSGSSRSFAAEHFLPKMLDRNFEGDYSLVAAQTDLVNIESMAQEMSAKLPIASSMIELYRLAMEQGLSSESKNAMLKVQESALGVELKR